MSSKSKYTHIYGHHDDAIFKDGGFLDFGGSIAVKELNGLHAALEEHHGNLLGVSADRDGWRTAAEKNAATCLAISKDLFAVTACHDEWRARAEKAEKARKESDDRWRSQVSGLKARIARLNDDVKKAEAELTSLREDKARLDYLEEVATFHSATSESRDFCVILAKERPMWTGDSCNHRTLRAAIEAARKAAK